MTTLVIVLLIVIILLIGVTLSHLVILRRKISENNVKLSIMHEEFGELVKGIDNQHRQLYADIISELINFKDERKDTLLAAEDDEELYDQARQLVIAGGRASTSYIQRILGIGYSRAAKILDMLEANGVIGPANGALPREILITEDEM